MAGPLRPGISLHGPRSKYFDLKVSMKDFNGLPKAVADKGESLYEDSYFYLASLTVKEFNRYAKTGSGGALMFIANQYAREHDQPVFYLGMYTES